MNSCERQKELLQVVRAGQWPQGSEPELREHVALCARCAEEARLLSAFAVARDSAMSLAAPPSPELLWWKAQLRRRHHAMQQLERPALTIPTATLAASVLVLVAVLATAWKRIQWSQLATSFSLAGKYPWLAVSVAVMLCALAVAAVLLGLGSSEERG